MSTSANPALFHIFIRQFWNVTFNKIVCQLALFLFYKQLLSSLLLVFLAGYFGFQVSARQLSAESGAERASKRRTNCGSEGSNLISHDDWLIRRRGVRGLFWRQRRRFINCRLINKMAKSLFNQVILEHDFVLDV